VFCPRGGGDGAAGNTRRRDERTGALQAASGRALPVEVSAERGAGGGRRGGGDALGRRSEQRPDEPAVHVPEEHAAEVRRQAVIHQKYPLGFVLDYRQFISEFFCTLSFYLFG